MQAIAETMILKQIEADDDVRRLESLRYINHIKTAVTIENEIQMVARHRHELIKQVNESDLKINELQFSLELFMMEARDQVKKLKDVMTDDQIMNLINIPQSITVLIGLNNFTEKSDGSGNS